MHARARTHVFMRTRCSDPCTPPRRTSSTLKPCTLYCDPGRNQCSHASCAHICSPVFWLTRHCCQRYYCQREFDTFLNACCSQWQKVIAEKDEQIAALTDLLARQGENAEDAGKLGIDLTASLHKRLTRFTDEDVLATSDETSAQSERDLDAQSARPEFAHNLSYQRYAIPSRSQIFSSVNLAGCVSSR